MPAQGIPGGGKGQGKAAALVAVFRGAAAGSTGVPGAGAGCQIGEKHVPPHTGGSHGIRLSLLQHASVPWNTLLRITGLNVQNIHKLRTIFKKQ